MFNKGLKYHRPLSFTLTNRDARLLVLFKKLEMLERWFCHHLITLKRVMLEKKTVSGPY